MLSSGSVWKPNPGEPPFLLPEVGTTWEADDAWVVFTDTSGGELATIYADTVTPQLISFVADNTTVDPIPQGANFEIFIDTDDGPVKIRYGKVLRREVEFPDAPAVQLQSIALNWIDTFPTLGLRSNWKAVSGRTKVYDNSSRSQPNGVSAAAELLFAKSAIRWDTPLNTDTVKSHVILLNQGQGKCNVIVCADQRFSTGLGVQFDSAANHINLGIVTGPTTMTVEQTLASHMVVDLDDYTITYDFVTATLAVYQGTSLSPLKTYTDVGGIVPHGPGYRYAGFSFDTGLLFQAGVEVATWQAKDN